MDINIENNNPNITRGKIIYHEALIDDLQTYLKHNVERLYQDPAEIIEKKENFLEQKQINSDNFQRLRDQVANSEQLKEQLIEEQEKNRILNSDKNNKDLIIQELELRLGDSPDIRIPSDNILPGEFPNKHLQEPRFAQPNTEYQQLMDKLNILINNINNKNEGSSSFSSNVFDEHNKLLINKRMSDIDEKLYDLTRKLNNKDAHYPPPNPYPVYPYFPPNHQFVSNPFQQVSNINNQISEEIKTPLSESHSNVDSISNQNNHQQESKQPLFSEDSSTPIRKEQIEDSQKYQELENKIKDLNQQLLADKKHTDTNVSPITVNINNNDHEHHQESTTPIEQHKKFEESENIFNDNEEEEINYNFGKITKPFDYIYNNTDDIIFEKKPVLLSGGKLEKFKKMRKLKKI